MNNAQGRIPTSSVRQLSRLYSISSFTRYRAGRFLFLVFFGQRFGIDTRNSRLFRLSALKLRTQVSPSHR